MNTVLVDKIIVSAIGMQTIEVTWAINRLLTGTDRKASFLFLNTETPSSSENKVKECRYFGYPIAIG